MSKQSNQKYRKEKDRRQSLELTDTSKNISRNDKTCTADQGSQGQNKFSHDFTSPTDKTKQ